MMKPRSLAVAMALLLALAGIAPTGAAPAAKARTLQVFAAASLSDAFTAIGHRLEEKSPGLEVRISFAGSQQLAAQLDQGAVADVFASADDRWMSHVREQGLLDGEPQTFAHNRLVVIIPKTNPARIHKLQDLARGGVKLVLGAETVPVGRYGRAVLKNLSRDPAFATDYATRVLHNVVSEEENVKSVVAKVQLGEADAGIVYRSDVTANVARYVSVMEIPEASNILASYPIAALKGARQPEAAREFVSLVLSKEGREILEHSGLMAADPGPR